MSYPKIYILAKQYKTQLSNEKLTQEITVHNQVIEELFKVALSV